MHSPRFHPLLSLACSAAAVLVAGCAGGPREIRPSDFAVAGGPSSLPVAAPPDQPTTGNPFPPDEPATPEATSEPDASSAPGPASGPAVATSEEGETAPARGPIVLDALVGQINGQPVYADELLADLDAQLAALGRRLEPRVFRRRATELIDTSLRERLVNALILGEAERALSEQQQAAVRYMVSERREDLLRRNGRGSLAVARKTLLEDTGIGLDETLRRFREGVITKNHVDSTIIARINVSRRDVERFYRENLDVFQPPVKRDLVLIRVDGAEAAKAVEARLDAGEGFEAVAADPATGNNWVAGAMTGIVGDKPFSRPAVDAAVGGLREVGDRVGPIGQPGPDDAERFWFVQASAVEVPEGQSLLEAQGAIEKTLRDRQFQQLQERLVQQLLRDGSHTPVDQMAAAVLRIAINRYGRPEA